MKKLKYVEKQVKKFSILFLAIILLVPFAMFFGCGGQAQSVTFPSSTKTILIDETYVLNVTSSPADLKISYSVADATIVQLLPDGKTVLGVKEGQTKIFARSESGVVAEMTMYVVAEKQILSTPSSFVFENQTSTLRWINVLNAYSYEVTVENQGKLDTYEVFSNRFCFDNLNTEYNEYTEYKITVKAKPAESSKNYIDSKSSEPFNLKQVFSVSNLNYNEDKIVFEYDLTALNLSETGEISFNLEILKNGNVITKNTINSTTLDGGKITFPYLPSEAGDYEVRVYTVSAKIQNSLVKKINITKLASPLITTDGSVIAVNGENGHLFKYFKTVNGIKEEISISGLTVEELENGEEVVYEAYTYKENSGKNFYINSDSAALTIKKLESPEGLRLEKLIGNNKAVRIVWSAIFPIENYDIYLNDNLYFKSSYTTEGGMHRVVMSNVFEEGRLYNIRVVANKNQEDNIYYLSSGMSSGLTVVKLAKPTIEYNEGSNSFVLTSPEINSGAIFNFTATYKNEEFKLVNEEISGTSQTFSLSGLNINLSGTCETVSAVTRNSERDDVVYLDSESSLYNITKIGKPTLSHEYSSLINGKLILSWPTIAGAGYYSIQIKNLTDNVLVSYSGSSITERNGVVSIEIDVFENGKNYQIDIQALSSTGTAIINGISTKFVGSEKSNLNVSKLPAPIVSISDKAIKSITFSWEEVSGADKYNIYINGYLSKITTDLTFSVSGMGVGEHFVSVVAISDDNTILPCSVVETNYVSYILMEQISEITYLKSTNGNSIISFNVIDHAGGYKLSIIDTNLNEIEFTSPSFSGGKASFLVPTSIFNEVGTYTLFAYATSAGQNIVQNEKKEKQISVLEGVSAIYVDEQDDAYIVWEYQGGLEVSGYDVYIEDVLMTDYEFRDEQGAIQTRYYIGGLSRGVYNIAIVAKGDNNLTIDSLPFTAQINKKENLESPLINDFGLKNSEIYSYFELSFKAVANAEYYRVYIVDASNNIKHYIQIDTSAEETVFCLLSRELFESGVLQYVYIRAFVVDNPIYSNSEIPSLSDSNQVVKIYKSAQIGNISISEDEKELSLHGLQAIFDGVFYKNITLTLPEILSGESLLFIARTVGSYIDYMIDGTFYMAGDWKDFEIIRLETPTVTIDKDNEEISWINSSTENVAEYSVLIKFFGLDDSVRNSVIKNLAVSSNSLTYEQIVVWILEGHGEELINYAGRYEIYVKALPTEQINGKICISSYNSSNETEFIVAGELKNTLVSGNILPEGIVELVVTKNNNNYISYFELLIQQGDNSTLIKIYKENNIPVVEVLSNSLNDFSGVYNIYEQDGMIYIYIDIQSILNEGIFSVSWNIFGKGVGDEIYSVSATDEVSLNAYKLKTPELEYSSDEYGNYVKIKEEVYSSYDEDVLVYAEYEGQKLVFTNGMLLLPYSWTTTSDIYVYAIKESEGDNGTIMSNGIYLDVEKYESVEGIRLETDNDKTFLKWNSQDDETQWIVYVYHNQGGAGYVVDSKELELTSEILPFAGEYTFKIAAYGNGSGIYNSDLVEFTATKLAANISLSNNNGVLNWTWTTQANVSGFRLNVSGNKKDFGVDVSLYNMSEYSGQFGVQIRLVGDISKNTISSDYTSVVQFYKFESPTTFKINAGQFNFGDEGDSNVTNSLFRIEIGNKTYSYQSVAGLEHISVFYGSDATSGEAVAFIAGGGLILVGGENVWTLNSNKTVSIAFNRPTVDSANEEQYLQQTITDGKVATYFNWSWTENGEVTKRRAVVYIKITALNLVAPNISGWTKVNKANGSLDYYYQQVDVISNYEEEIDKTVFSVSLSLPEGLLATTYTINVQKADYNENGTTLSSKLSKSLSFLQLAKPGVYLSDGKLVWSAISSVERFLIRYTDTIFGTGGEQSLVKSARSYELGSSFADTNDETYKAYNFKLIALGNVPYVKPEELPDANYLYIVASQTGEIGNVKKPRTAGDLKLSNGGLEWEISDGYHTYGANTNLEFAFYDSGERLVATVRIDANKFNVRYPNNTSNILLEDLFTSNIKALFKRGETYTIKYRELGGAGFANSEYKDLQNNIIVDGNPAASKQFKLGPTITNLSISDSGLVWTPITRAEGELTTINYDIFFTLSNGTHVYATTVVNNNLITISEIKGLSAFKNNLENNITNIFIVVRGDSKKFISGFNSPTVAIKAILENEIGLSVDEGKIKWSDVELADSYDIKTTINNKKIEYRIYKEGSKYFMDKYVDENLTETRIELNSVLFDEVTKTWSWDWAQDENIEEGILYNLYIRYNPKADEGIFPIPGEYSTVALKVYKLAAAEPTTVNGDLSWTAVANAEKYIVRIKYFDAVGEIHSEELDTTLTKLSLKISNRGQTRIEISVQVIGPSGIGNEVYYINTLIEYNAIAYLNNTITNFVRNGDIIEWSDEGVSGQYEIMVYDSNGNFVKSVITSEKKYDLSILKLSSSKSYVVYIKVLGNTGDIGEGGSGYLSSFVLTDPISFSVFAPVEVIEMLDGEIVWEVDSTKEYKVYINSGSGNKYVYTIGLNGGKWEVLSLTRNGIIIASTSSVTSFSEGGKNYIKFWPAEMDENKSTTISVAVAGKEVASGYYVTSDAKSLSSTVVKPIASLLNPSGTYDEETKKITFIWRSFTNFIYDIIIEKDGVEIEINSVNKGIGLVDSIFELDLSSETDPSGTYTFKVRRYSRVSETTVKTNYVSIQVVIP